MKSIRASLIVYFWLLLGLGLGTASLLAYRIAAESLQVKQEAARQLLDAKYRDDAEKVRKGFDDELFRMAKDVARAAVTLYQFDRLTFSKLLALGLMDTTYAHGVAPIWVAEVTHNPPGTLGSQVGWNMIRRITVEDEELARASDAAGHEYFQINTPSGQTWRSPTLGDQTLPFDTGDFAHTELHTARYDDLHLADGRSVRRVMYKYPARRRFLPSMTPPGPPGRGTRGRPDRPDSPRPDRSDRPDPPRPGEDPPRQPRDRGPADAWVPWIVVQCAADPTSRDKAFAELDAKLGGELSAQDAAAQESLAALRRRLVATALVTFLLTTVGGYLLVGVGLAPLRRVTDAVSRVSVRDFRLPLEADEPLPNELAPIRERLQHTLDELRKAFEREKQAAADISHELRTPVASMLTTVEVALRKPRSADEYRQTLEECRGVARQMRHLVERIMALARLDAGSDRLRPRPVNVGELVRECAALVKPLAGERGLELRVDCPKPVLWSTDPDKLREVVVNLLHNAVEYNRPAGSIDVSAQEADGWLDVQVHDTGVGISKEAFGHIFERFYRADPSRHASELHAGLGLSIVKGYVGLLGGTITVESQVGQGSTFRVRLPSAATAA